MKKRKIASIVTFEKKLNDKASFNQFLGVQKELVEMPGC